MAAPLRKRNTEKSSATSSVTAPTRRSSEWDFLASGGEMGERIRSFNWAGTPIGSIETWPTGLRNAVSILLRSPFPMTIIWGHAFIFLYNDALIPVAGDKHPSALGKSAFEHYPEIWPIVGPQLESVLATGKASSSEDSLLVIDRKGYLEETYETYSYIPIILESGEVGGSFEVTIPTTDRVIGERRLRTVRDLALSGAKATSSDEACRLAATVLANNLFDVPFALLYLVEANQCQVHLAACSGITPGTPASPEFVGFNDNETGRKGWALGQAAAGKRARIDSLESMFGNLPGGAWPVSPQSALVYPLVPPGHQRPTGILVAAISPRKELDAPYQTFFELIVSQISATFANVLALETERRRLEALAALDRAKTAFFSNVSHEFRTPITLALGRLEELLQSSTSLSGEDRTKIEVAFRNGLRLQKLVNALLDFSRMEAGRAKVSYTLTDVSVFTAEVASAFQPIIERAGMRFVVDCAPLAVPVYLDTEMWEKIVLNLLSNAFKYTFEGEIRVLVQQVGQNVEFSVTDTGVGIPEGELNRVFDRFHRVEGVHGRTSEGTGIGLALVQEMVKLHGGSVKVQSAYGHGSTFTVSIPLGKDHLPPDGLGISRTLPTTRASLHAYVDEALASLPGPISTVKAGACMRPRVLLADDNADMREYISSLLGGDYDVTAVVNGQEALAEALRRPPDLILSDVMMPHMDGFELLAALRSDEKTRTIPVVMLSARADEEAKIEGLQMGADDYLSKPFSSRELRARVASQIELAHLRHELIRRSEAAVQSLAGRLINAHDEERNRISRELHDDIGQKVGLLSLMLETYKQKSRRKELMLNSTNLSELQHSIEDIVYSVQELSHGLHSSALRLGLRSALQGLCRTASEKHNIKVNFESDDVSLSDQASLSFFRVAQEALSNAVKHGDAREILIRLHAETGLIRMDIKDNGRGFDTVVRTSGLGLVSMEERLRMIGGELRITSRLGEGTEVRAQLRLPKGVGEAA